MEMTEGNGNKERKNRTSAGQVPGRTTANDIPEHLEHTNTDEPTEDDGRTADNLNRETFKQRIRTLFRNRKFVIATVTTFVFALAVIMYVLVSLKKEGKDVVTGHCPKYSTNGTIVKTTGSSYGDTIEITCDEKSKLNGPNVITCLSTGNWSGFSQCIPKLCNNFTLSDNMKVESEIENIGVGTTVTVNCGEGSVLIGENTVVCLSNEQWSEKPTCKIIDCGTPESVANAVITNISDTTYNSIFFVECEEGYLISGSNIVKCNLYGNWESMPICKMVTCGLPTIPGNGSLSHISGTSFQASASIKCDEGYLLTGDPIINCLSNGTWSDIPTCDNFTDCLDVLLQGKITQDGVYDIITSKSLRKIQVYCDMTIDGGGWTVFQNRFDGSVEFYRNFSEYEIGFGQLNGEFWLGLKSVQEMASQGKTELRLDLTAADGTTAYETFQNFYLDEGPNYTLHIDRGTGTAGDSQGLSYNNGRHFTTYDADRDSYSGNCAVYAHGGWWYGSCTYINLNGEYVTPGTERLRVEGGMIYHAFQRWKSLKSVKMMFRRV